MSIGTDDDDDDYVSDADDEYDGVLLRGGCEKRGFKVCDLTDAYYPEAFRLLGQLACKDLVKIWIRTCHEGKQTSHPYNGKDTAQESMRVAGYQGHFKKPDYWPSDEGWNDKKCKGCRHKEPDHIKKPGGSVIIAAYILKILTNKQSD